MVGDRHQGGCGLSVGTLCFLAILPLLSAMMVTEAVVPVIPVLCLKGLQHAP